LESDWKVIRSKAIAMRPQSGCNATAERMYIDSQTITRDQGDLDRRMIQSDKVIRSDCVPIEIKFMRIQSPRKASPKQLQSDYRAISKSQYQSHNIAIAKDCSAIAEWSSHRDCIKCCIKKADKFVKSSYSHLLGGQGSGTLCGDSLHHLDGLGLVWKVMKGDLMG
jgi:hypothetical protein